MRILNKIFIIFILIDCPAIGNDSYIFTSSLKTAKMLERKGDVDGAIAIYQDILSKDPEIS